MSLSESTLTFVSLAETTQLTATVTDANGETIEWSHGDVGDIGRCGRDGIIHRPRDFSR